MSVVAPKPERQPEIVLEALGCADLLYSLARRLTGSPGDGEDLIQDTYARALDAWESFTPGTNVRA